MLQGGGYLVDGLRHGHDLDEAHVAGAGHLVQGPGHAPDAPVLAVQGHALVHSPRVIQGPVLLQDVVIPGHENGMKTDVDDVLPQ